LATISAGESAAVTATYLSTAVRFAGTVQVFVPNAEHTSGDGEIGESDFKLGPSRH
jgi:hypothetical protein